ncbi:MAG: polysaccharide deacetylase family protein [Armatimonadetes bacterium]|nr:polysaccharide deacetylase family protein [Armatimonadota bacterium]
MGVPILMYHRIAARPAKTTVPHHYVHPERFGRHVKGLARTGYATVSLSRLTEAFATGSGLPPKPIVLTFDDGYANFGTEAAPRMAAHGASGTVFVVSGLIGGQNKWDSDRGDAVERLLTAEQIVELDKAGFEVGSHTVVHARLTDCDDDRLRDELVRSREDLSTLLNKDVTQFCYPYGAHDGRVRAAVRDAGYAAACSVEKGCNDPETDRYRWKRINVRSDTTTPILFWKIWRASRRSPAVG